MAANHAWPSTCTDTQLSIIAEMARVGGKQATGVRPPNRLTWGWTSWGVSRFPGLTAGHAGFLQPALQPSWNF